MIAGLIANIGIPLLFPACAHAATISGLRQQSETKVTAEMAGAPFEGDHPPFIWAISADKPGSVLRKFETPTQVQLAGLHTIVWSPDSRFLAVTPWGNWDHAAVVQMDDGHLDVFADRDGALWCDGAQGLIPGPRIVQQCTRQGSVEKVLRFLSVEGRVTREWSFAGAFSLLQVSQDGRMLALDFPEPASGGSLSVNHDVAIFNIADRTEVQRWSLPKATLYGGTFAHSGKVFCTAPDPNFVSSEHEVICRNVMRGEVVSRFSAPKGPIGIGAAGDRLLLRHSAVLSLPFRLFGTNALMRGSTLRMLDLLTGRAVAQWSVPTMTDVNFASAVSDDGRQVAISDAAEVRIYHVEQY